MLLFLDGVMLLREKGIMWESNADVTNKLASIKSFQALGSVSGVQGWSPMKTSLHSATMKLQIQYSCYFSWQVSLYFNAF